MVEAHWNLLHKLALYLSQFDLIVLKHLNIIFEINIKGKLKAKVIHLTKKHLNDSRFTGKQQDIL